MKQAASRVAIPALLLSALLLSACDDSEQGRTLRYEKGTYLGQEDQKLTDEQVDQLRLRTTRQGG